MKHHQLGDKWIKASIAGTIWAASEIVLGGFLHNLRIPFSGNILTAIGIIILVSISHVWKEKGLFWRAGLICALMKTMSPSAVIFGPMISIFSEGVLLEISTRILGRNLTGYLLGSMLAVAWNLFYKIINLIIFYGMNIVKLYENLLTMAAKQLHIEMDIVWLPILFLLVVQLLFGLAAGVIGIRVGRRLVAQKNEQVELPGPGRNFTLPKQKISEFPYSLVWLFANVVMMVGALVLLSLTSWMYWSGSIVLIVVIWSMRYKRALRQLSKPGFWIFFVVITMAAAFIWVDAPPGVSRWEQGLLIGIEMNFRAVVIILGFSVLGTELYNPKIREFFMKTYFRQLPMALELSASSLPSMISGIPEWKVMVKDPVSVFYGIISQAGIRLEEIRKGMERKVILITGGRGEGKTTFIAALADFLKKEGIGTGGIFCPRLMEGETTTGYDIVNIASGSREPLFRRTDEGEVATIGRYRIFDRGLQAGLLALQAQEAANRKVMIVDETGRLELEGGGWAGSISALLEQTECHILLSVRDTFAPDVVRRWDLEGCTTFHIGDFDRETLCERILDLVI